MKVKVVTLKNRPFGLRWIDRTTGTERQESTGTYDREEAQRKASEKAAELSQALLPAQLLWTEVRQRFEAERMPAMSAGSRETYGVTFKLFEQAVGPVAVRCINAGVVSQFQAALRKRGCKEITILKHTRQLRSVLQWAFELELIERLPAIPRPVRGSIPRTMKGRPLTVEEFKRFLAAIGEVVRSDQVEAWTFFARGLWYQGLRVGEALQLSWDREDRHRVDLGRDLPMIWIRGQLEKGKRDRQHPIAPEFAELLRGIPQEQRKGPVFKLPQVSRSHVSHVGSNIGKQAGLLVRKDALTGQEKYASFHDLRRSCALRWAEKLLPQNLMEFMRHSSMQVTMDYYVGQRASQTAARMWEEYEAEKGQTGVVSGGDKKQNHTSSVSSETADTPQNAES